MKDLPPVQIPPTPFTRTVTLVPDAPQDQADNPITKETVLAAVALTMILCFVVYLITRKRSDT